MANINKKALANLVQAKLTKEATETDKGRKITKVFANEAVDAVLDAIAESLQAGDNVKLVGFGNFELRERAGRTGRNPQTGEEMEISGRTAPAWKPAKSLKDSVKDVTPNEVASDDESDTE